MKILVENNTDRVSGGNKIYTCPDQEAVVKSVMYLRKGKKRGRTVDYWTIGSQITCLNNDNNQFISVNFKVSTGEIENEDGSKSLNVVRACEKLNNKFNRRYVKDNIKCTMF